MTSFKHIRELGLGTIRIQANKQLDTWTEPYIRASDLEAILEKGVPVTGYKRFEEWIVGTTPVRGEDTHQGIAIGMKPIRKERRRELTEAQVREAFAEALEVRNSSGWSTGELIIQRLFGSGQGQGEGV